MCGYFYMCSINLQNYPPNHLGVRRQWKNDSTQNFTMGQRAKGSIDSMDHRENCTNQFKVHILGYFPIFFNKLPK